MKIRAASSIFLFLPTAALGAACAAPVDRQHSVAMVSHDTEAESVDEFLSGDASIKVRAKGESRPGMVTFVKPFKTGALQLEVEWHDRAALHALLAKGPFDIEVNVHEVGHFFAFSGQRHIEEVSLDKLASLLVDKKQNALCGKRTIAGKATVAVAGTKHKVFLGLGWMPLGTVTEQLDNGNCPLGGYVFNSDCNSTHDCTYSLSIPPIYTSNYDGFCAGLLICSCGPIAIPIAPVNPPDDGSQGDDTAGVGDDGGWGDDGEDDDAGAGY
jgi:hypothetical protein